MTSTVNGKRSFSQFEQIEAEAKARAVKEIELKKKCEEEYFEYVDTLPNKIKESIARVFSPEKLAEVRDSLDKDIEEFLHKTRTRDFMTFSPNVYGKENRIRQDNTNLIKIFHRYIGRPHNFNYFTCAQRRSFRRSRRIHQSSKVCESWNPYNISSGSSWKPSDIVDASARGADDDDQEAE
jgi:hypothetical protein